MLPPFNLMQAVPDPVVVRELSLLRRGKRYFVQARSTDGVEAVILASERAEYCRLLLERVAPHFVGVDARDIESSQETAYRHGSNYKLTGLPYWCCIGWLDFALLELMGQTTGKSVGEILGGVRQREFGAYLSSLRRDTTAEEEVAWLGEEIERTGASAVKVKIGGRMSRNADAFPGRTESLIAHARKTWGEKITIYVDSNGSYDAPKAIEVGKMLEQNGVAWFEEPCPWEDYRATKAVADALTIPVAGGEQDSSLLRFRDMTESRTVDVVQPDMNYCGGLLRACRVAQMAEEAGLPVVPHSPQGGPHSAYVLQFASRTANFGAHFEFRAGEKAGSFYSPRIDCENGVVAVPSGPGFGITYDAEYLKGAEVVFTAKAEGI